MFKVDTFTAYIITLMTSLIGFLFCGVERYVTFLAIAVILDVITGVVAAGFEGNISSTHFFGNLSKGLVRKMLMLSMLGFVAYGSVVSGLLWARDSLLIFYIAGEGLSLLENLDRCGVPFPQFLKDMFDSMRNKGNDGIDHD